jgi:hypothetical protein
MGRRNSLSQLGGTRTTRPIEIPVVADLMTKFSRSAKIIRAGELTGDLFVMIQKLVKFYLNDGDSGAQEMGLKSTWKMFHPEIKAKLNFHETISSLADYTSDLIREYRVSLASPCLGLERFFTRLLQIRLLNGVLGTISLDGFIHYRKEIFDTVRECRCGMCKGGKCIGALRSCRPRTELDMPPGSLFWEAEQVFSSALFVATSCAEDHPDLTTVRHIRPDDIGMPLSLSEDPAVQAAMECCLCQDDLNPGNRLIQTRDCKHIFCSSCALIWANQVPDGDAYGITCPMCRREIDPPALPYAWFMLNEEGTKRYHAMCTWCDIPPSHWHWGLENAWEEEEVDVCVRCATAAGFRLPK